MKIAVLCGGLSNERDVSISSGTGIARALRERGNNVALVDGGERLEGSIVKSTDLRAGAALMLAGLMA